MILTILTPVFNRNKGILSLYDSLENQTKKNFEWLIVDDGSTDKVINDIKKIQKASTFPIRYIYKENGGKHTALNVGIKMIQSDLTFIVDSDDILTSNAVETIFRFHNRYGGMQKLCGYSFLRAFPNGKINGYKFATDEWIASYIQTRINSHDTMSDKAEVFFTRCLKEFPFPEYPGEKFLGEDIVWVRMARKYNMVHINEIIYVGDYQTDGLTRHRREHNIKSPVGCMYRAEEFMCNDIELTYRIKANLQFIIYGLFAKRSLRSLLRESRDKMLTFICIIPGMIIKIIWSRS